jgi:hypothetical protein
MAQLNFILDTEIIKSLFTLDGQAISVIIQQLQCLLNNVL